MSTPLYKNLPKEINKTARNLSEDHEDLVYCIGWHENKEWKEVEVASDFSVYPCCSLHAEHQLNDTYFDKKLDSMDKDWNNLKHNKLKDILEIWHRHIKPEYWKDEKTLPGCCNHICRIKND